MDKELMVIAIFLAVAVVFVILITGVSYIQMGNVVECEDLNCGSLQDQYYHDCAANCLNGSKVYGITVLDKTKYLVRGGNYNEN